VARDDYGVAFIIEHPKNIRRQGQASLLDVYHQMASRGSIKAEMISDIGEGFVKAG
jgi:hypothetical protein